MPYEASSPTSTDSLPSDLPDPKDEHKKGVPDGAIFRSPSTGQRYRLRHPEPARWTPIVTRARVNS